MDGLIKKSTKYLIKYFKSNTKLRRYSTNSSNKSKLLYNGYYYRN